jgi:hypothetical protein
MVPDRPTLWRVVHQKFTFMLTWNELEALVSSGRLMRWNVQGRAPPAGGRALYMEKDVHEKFTDQPWPASQGELPRHTSERRTAMRLTLERYVLGHAVLLNRELKELGSDRARTTMRGFWSIRSQGRMEETRLLGHFARPGAFVATRFAGRGEFRDDPDWQAAKNASDVLWNTLTTKKYLMARWPVRLRNDLSAYLGV